MTFFDILNKFLEASRSGDIIMKKIYSDMMDDVEPTYADLLDTINY